MLYAKRYITNPKAVIFLTAIFDSGKRVLFSLYQREHPALSESAGEGFFLLSPLSFSPLKANT